MLTHIRLFASLSCLALLMTACSPGHETSEENTDANSETVTWVRENAHPMQTVEPGNGLEDLHALGEMIGDARLVGFGEATHGNREVFQLKHRVFEYLVEEKGFTIFALESPFAETSDLNNYVLHGEGSAEEALASLTMWAWDTEELADLLNWMRAYNQDPANSTKLKVYGFDMQAPERASRLTLDYLDRVDPDLRAAAEEELGQMSRPFSDPDELGWMPIIYELADEASLQMAQQVVTSLEENRDAYIAQSNEVEWSDTHQMALQVLWWIDAYSRDGTHSVLQRDRIMADNIDWILEREGEDAKAFVWAHNSHLTSTPIVERTSVPLNMLGWHLEERYGDDFINIAGLADRGEMTALEAAPDGIVQVFEWPESGPEFLEYQLVQAGLDVALVDMNTLPEDGPVHEYFSEPVLTRHSGGGYNEDNVDRYVLSYQFPQSFDIIAFVRDNTHTRHINIEDYRRVPRTEDPSNLGFENADPDGVPASWIAWTKQIERWGVSVSQSEDATEGNYSAQICRETGRMSPDVAGSLVQRINASELEGETLTLRVSARLDPISEEASAFLRLKIMPDPDSSAHDSSLALYDNLDRDLVESSDWADYTLQTEIPEGTDTILIGLFLRGEGCAWIDDVRWSVSE